MNREEQGAQLWAEEAHRAKNMLAAVQTVVRQSLRGNEPVQVMRERLLARLEAVAGVYDLLLRAKWEAVGFDALALAALNGLDLRGRVTLGGEAQVLVAPHIAVSFCFALHELAARLPRDATAELRWTASGVAGGKRVELIWAESGPQATASPEDQFGARLLDSVSHDLGATLERTTDGNGRSVRMEIPVGESVSVLTR